MIDFLARVFGPLSPRDRCVACGRRRAVITLPAEQVDVGCQPGAGVGVVCQPCAEWLWDGRPERLVHYESDGQWWLERLLGLVVGHAVCGADLTADAVDSHAPGAVDCRSCLAVLRRRSTGGRVLSYDPDRVVHALSRWQYWMGRLGLTIPHGVCGMTLAGTGRLDPDASMCPDCAATLARRGKPVVMSR